MSDHSFSLPLVILAIFLGQALSAQEIAEQSGDPFENSSVQPILVSWYGQASLEKRNLAPLGKVVQDSASFKELWRSWRPDEKVPDVNFDRMIAIVDFGSDPNVLGVGIRRGVDGNLMSSVITSAMGFRCYSTFTYQISLVSRDGVRSVEGRSLFSHGLLRANQQEHQKHLDAAIELYTRIINDPQVAGEEGRIAALLRWRVRRVLGGQLDIEQDITDAKLVGHQGLEFRVRTMNTFLESEGTRSQIKKNDRVLVARSKDDFLWVEATNDDPSKSGWISRVHLKPLNMDLDAMTSNGVGTIRANRVAKQSFLKGPVSVDELISMMTKQNQSRRTSIEKEHHALLARVKQKNEEFERRAPEREAVKRRVLEYLKKNNLEHLLEASHSQ